MNEVALLHQAFTNYEQLTGGKANIPKEFDKNTDNLIVELHHDTSKLRLKAQVNRLTLSKSVLGLLKHQLQNDKIDLILTHYVSDVLAEEMRKLRINFLDAAGNMYISQSGLFLLVQGRKKANLQKPETIKLFQPAGLRILYQLLKQPDNPTLQHPVNKPLRALAELADVSLGSVHKALADLEQLGYLVKVNAKEKKLINTPELIERWVEGYGEILRPKLSLGIFKFAKEETRESWRLLKLNNQKTRWGGEAAAALYTNHINPKRFTLYTTENQGDLMRNYRLLPHAEGDIEVLLYPAKSISSLPFKGHFTCVPPLLTFADLMTTTDPRNHETAKIIKNEYLTNLA